MHSEALKGNPRHSDALRRTQTHSEALRGTQRHSEALSIVLDQAAIKSQSSRNQFAIKSRT